jgi:CheY-like chemotaxis protein
MIPTILLVEDDDDDVFLFRDTLSELNITCELIHVSNGLEGIKKLNLMKPEKPDFIFTDLNMPVMMGLKFLREIKKVRTFVDIPVFILTSSLKLSDKEESLAAGAAGYFKKSLKGDELKTIILNTGENKSLKPDKMKKPLDPKLQPLLSNISDMVCTLEEIRSNLARANWSVKIAERKQAKIDDIINKWAVVLSETNSVVHEVKEEIDVCDKYFNVA